MILFLGWLVVQPGFSTDQMQTTDLKQAAIQHIDSNSGLLIEISDSIWECAEIALLEFRSAEILADAAEKVGFTVEQGVADLPTAFVANFGSGRPIIGILAEYDALPGLSQDATPYPKVLAMTGLDFLTDENLRLAAWKEFKEKLGGYTYTSGIPRDKKPPVRKKNRELITSPPQINPECKYL